MGNILRTWWEYIGNRSTHPSHPSHPKPKRTKLRGYMLSLHIGRMRFLFFMSPFSTSANTPLINWRYLVYSLHQMSNRKRSCKGERYTFMCTHDERHLSLQVGGMLWLPVNNLVAITKWLSWNLWFALHLTHCYFEIVVQCIILYLGNLNIEDILFHN
jgi:hypothetical protein